jgi:hypothetical protein
MNANLITEVSANPTRRFRFKTKTVSNTAARIEVIEYDNDTVLVTKIVTSKVDVPGYIVIKSFLNYKVIAERILLKKSSLFAICKEVFNPSGGGN